MKSFIVEMAFHLAEDASLIVPPNPCELHSPKHRLDLGGIPVSWQWVNGSYRRLRTKSRRTAIGQ